MPGLVEALGEVHPDAACQRCVVHFYRNVFSVTPSGKAKQVAAMLKAIHAQEDRSAADEKLQQVIARLEMMKLGRAAQTVREGIADTLAYISFPREHWRRIHTNNPLSV